jgi:hypothetical protein
VSPPDPAGGATAKAESAGSTYARSLSIFTTTGTNILTREVDGNFGGDWRSIYKSQSPTGSGTCEIVPKLEFVMSLSGRMRTDSYSAKINARGFSHRHVRDENSSGDREYELHACDCSISSKLAPRRTDDPPRMLITAASLAGSSVTAPRSPDIRAVTSIESPASTRLQWT